VPAAVSRHARITPSQLCGPSEAPCWPSPARIICWVQAGGRDLDDADEQENELSVQKGFRILSAYGQGDRKLWMITEADRNVTTILRPDEY
jgi:hypothetical protein